MALGALALTVGCQRDDGEYPQWWTFPDDERIWESEHFIYHSYPDDDATCPEVLNILEQHFRKSQEYLGFPWPKGSKVGYYKFQNIKEVLQSDACGYASPCASYGFVFAHERVQAHELIHSYFGADKEFRHPFLDEGLAEAVTCEFPVSPFLPEILPPWREAVEQGTDDSGVWLVAYLLSRYPVSQFVDWFRSTRYGMSADEVGALFEETYGFPLDEAWKELPSIADERFPCPLALECTGPPLPLDGSSTELFFCGEASAYRSFQVDEPTTLILQANLPFLATGLMQCAGPRIPAASLQNGVKNGSDTTILNLEPGLYGFGVDLYTLGVEAVPAFDDAPLYREEAYRVSAQLSPSPILAPSCEEAIPFAWSETSLDSAWATWTIPEGDAGDVQYARLVPGPGYQILMDQNVPNVSVSRCDGCAGECAPAKDHDSVFPDADGIVTLRFERTKSGSAVAPSIAWLSIE